MAAAVQNAAAAVRAPGWEAIGTRNPGQAKRDISGGTHAVMYFTLGRADLGMFRKF